MALLEEEGTGLNDAFARAAEHAGGAAVAFLVAELPCVTGVDLDRVLSTVPLTAPAVVGDADGTGTVLLWSRWARRLCPQFGGMSLARHRLALATSPAGGVARWAATSTPSSRCLKSLTTPSYRVSNRAGSCCVFPTPPGNRPQPGSCRPSMACCHVAAIRGVVSDQRKRAGQLTGGSVTKQLGVTLQGSACGARLFWPFVSGGTVAFARVLDLIRCTTHRPQVICTNVAPTR
jgi:hypothetical protein